MLKLRRLWLQLRLATLEENLKARKEHLKSLADATEDKSAAGTRNPYRRMVEDDLPVVQQIVTGLEKKYAELELELSLLA